MSSEEEGIDNAEGPSPPDSPGKSKDSALLKPKPQPKVIRVLTVFAYILSVSMAAILLSIYYIFMWKGEPHLGARKSAPSVNGTIAYRLAEPLKFQSPVLDRGSNDNQPATASTYSDENVTELVGVEDERAMQQQITDDDFFSSLTSTTEESTTWSDYDLNSDQDPDFARTSTFIQKLMGGDPYSEND